MSAGPPMTTYARYVDSLRHTTRLVLEGRLDPAHASVAAALNGQAASELRRLVPSEERRKSGAFFTGSEIRTRVRQAVSEHGFAPYFDAACGAGDLLLAAAETLRTGDDSLATLTSWSDQLLGRDISPSFVSASRARLVLAAVARHEAGQVRLGRPFFRGVSVGDGTASTVLGARRGTLLLNPPFGKQQAPPSCQWGSGGVSRAALYLEHAVRRLSPGSKVIAILPDVLRSGSSLGRYRADLESLIDVIEIVELGQFDPWTDIDVFLLVGRRRPTPARRVTVDPRRSASWTSPPTSAGPTLGEFFEVRVGPVVHTRDAMTGPWCPFLVAHELPRSGVVTLPASNRRFAGRTFQPPFVVVRRTDRPSKAGPRAVAVTVTGGKPVAVENHLLVLRPLDGRIETCQQAAEWLASDAIRTYLDLRIRCRHLTTAAVRDAPAPTGWESPFSRANREST